MKTRPGSLVLSTTLAGLMTLALAGCNQPQEAAGTPPAGTSAATEIDDSMLATRVKSALLADPDLRSFYFEIETRKGEVRLSGLVDDPAQVERALAVAREVVGVKGVESKVGVKGAAVAGGR
ncbi:MAG: BON domain-containing protein [Burkholderiales bacterium]